MLPYHLVQIDITNVILDSHKHRLGYLTNCIDNHAVLKEKGAKAFAKIAYQYESRYFIECKDIEAKELLRLFKEACEFINQDCVSEEDFIWLEGYTAVVR